METTDGRRSPGSRSEAHRVGWPHRRGGLSPAQGSTGVLGLRLDGRSRIRWAEAILGCLTFLIVHGRVHARPSRSWSPPHRTRSGRGDITRLRGPRTWTCYYLYVLLDLFSRYVAGWMVADRENSALAQRLIEETCLKHGVEPDILTLHSDRGAPMTSQGTAQLLARLGVNRSLGRPQVSEDNPYSEAHFKTLKYHPDFPGRFRTRTRRPPTAGPSSPGTTPSTGMPASPC